VCKRCTTQADESFARKKGCHNLQFDVSVVTKEVEVLFGKPTVEKSFRNVVEQVDTMKRVFLILADHKTYITRSYGLKLIEMMKLFCSDVLQKNPTTAG